MRRVNHLMPGFLLLVAFCYSYALSTRRAESPPFSYLTTYIYTSGRKLKPLCQSRFRS